MKTTLFALNEKLQMLNDIRQEAAENRKYFTKSEGTRGELQEYINKVGLKVTEDTKAHDAKHQERIEEIKRLKDEIQRLKSEQSQKEKEHLNNIEQLN